jgi:hypothetical protein
VNARRDRGSTTIELAILAPAVITFFVVALIAGRYAIALQAADSAAFDAARNASLSRTEAAAVARATVSASDSFAAQGIRCRNPVGVQVDTSGFAVPVGQPGTVSVTVICVVELSDIALPGMPGSTTLHSTFVSPLDTYRSRR